MNGNPFTFELTPAAFWRWGRVALGSALAFGLALVLLMTWKAPMLLLGVPAVLLGGVALWYLVQRPLLHLCVVLLGFASILQQVEGVQWYEALYGLYYVSYLAGWFAWRLFFQRKPVLRTTADWAMALFMLWATATLAMSVVFRADPMLAVQHWISFLMLGFYFPIKEAYLQEGERALKALLGVFAALAFFIAARNFYTYYQALQNAEQLWQIASGRVRLNERFLMVGALGMLAFFLYGRRRSGRLLSVAALSVLLAGIVIGQSRAVWMATLLGIGILFLLADRRRKGRLVLLGGAGVAVVMLFGMVFVNDFLALVVGGIIDRFASLENAATSDPSLVNRFHEWAAVWEEVKKNPILGYGFGVPYEFFQILERFTESKAYLHNAYLGLWYRHGIIGLTLALFAFLSVAWSGLRLALKKKVRRLDRIALLTALASLVALALAATTEALLLSDDGALILAIPAALTSGLWQRYSFRTTERP